MAVGALAFQQLLLSPRRSSRRSQKLLQSPSVARSLRAGSSALATEFGELGWQHLQSAESVDLKLGTLVGAGSYGIVREADLRGAKVGWSAECSSVLTAPFDFSWHVGKVSLRYVFSMFGAEVSCVSRTSLPRKLDDDRSHSRRLNGGRARESLN